MTADVVVRAVALVEQHPPLLAQLVREATDAGLERLVGCRDRVRTRNGAGQG